MSLMTTRPRKHPETGIYYLRRAVPADLLALIGKREEKISLGAKDPARAKSLMPVPSLSWTSGGRTSAPAQSC
ncbi:DUF6538 domain-containing protein [Methylorubrum populi]|uniref:DUF6538 domain-containing protein n=2 Tax=Methylobacteriaceae TaxID=119045 RepID=UPI002F35FE70